MHGGKAMVKIFDGRGLTTSFPLREPSGRRCGKHSPSSGSRESIGRGISIVAMKRRRSPWLRATKITGKPQAVLLHATAGTLNAAMFLRAAYQERVSMVICCGETSAFGESRPPDPGTQWIHDLTDIGGPAELLAVASSGAIASFSPTILRPEPRAGNANCRGTTGGARPARRPVRVHAR